MKHCEGTRGCVCNPPTHTHNTLWREMVHRDFLHTCAFLLEGVQRNEKVVHMLHFKQTVGTAERIPVGFQCSLYLVSNI